MEDTLRVIFWDEDVPGLIVLILVLMEDTLREGSTNVNNKDTKCLNPCFNGRYSQSTDKAIENYNTVLS